MGLDISAYSNIKVLGFGDYDEDLEDKVEFEYINPGFPHAVPPEWLDSGERFVRWVPTKDTEDFDFGAGSYSGYNYWRASLVPTGLESRDIWNEPEKWAKLPFVELINFSDCEGVMAGPVCEKLYNDFKEKRELYASRLTEDDSQYYLGKYDDWTEAFELARHDGLVSFH